MSQNSNEGSNVITDVEETKKLDEKRLESELCYNPIESIEELLEYNELSPPKCTLLQDTIPLARSFGDTKIQMNGRRFHRGSCPKTLVCHDFKGGYLDDRFVHGTKNSLNYVFRHWLQTDIFCYFSHKFVTIPPLGWINAAHSHGVQIIGTIITESEDGKKLCQELLKDVQTMEKAVEKLCSIAQHYKFDGYLVNCENELDQPRLMIDFLALLTTKMKLVVSDSIVLWYDSVTVDGKLSWQNELNNTNKAFFNVCDGIYLNYGWKDEQLHRSVEVAEDREFDVYVGVDVFGRGCFGGGGLETCQAVEKVAAQRLSLAIFAPGWTFECHPYENFPAIDDQLWNKCSKYFYFRSLVNPKTSIKSKPGYQVFMSTHFNQGVGESNYILGLKENVEENGWYNLSQQSYQPVINCFRPSDWNTFGFQASFDSNKAFLGGGSLKLSREKLDPLPDDPQLEPGCPLWIPLNVNLSEFKEEDSKCGIVAVVAWQRIDPIPDNALESNPIKLFVEFMSPNISNREVIRLSNVTEQIAFDMPSQIDFVFKDFLPKEYVEKCEEIEELTFSIKEVPYAEHTLNGWTISCFMMDITTCLDRNITAFRLGAQQTVSVGLVSLALLSY